MKRTSALCARCGAPLQGRDPLPKRLLRRLKGEFDVCPKCYLAIVHKVTGVSNSGISDADVW